MFVRDKSLSRLEVAGEIVDLYRSINRARIAPEGAEAQPCDVAVIAIKNGTPMPFVFVVLFLTVNRVRQVYVPEQQPATAFEYERSLQEALDFAESIGFMLDSVEMDENPQRRTDMIKSIPALYVPGLDPDPGSHRALFSSTSPVQPLAYDNLDVPAASMTVKQTVSKEPGTSPGPSDLLSRLRSLVQQEIPQDSASSEKPVAEAPMELILDDISLFEDISDDEGIADSAMTSVPEISPPQKEELDSLDGIAFFDDYAPMEMELHLPSEGPQSVPLPQTPDEVQPASDESLAGSFVFDDRLLDSGEALSDMGATSDEPLPFENEFPTAEDELQFADFPLLGEQDGHEEPLPLEGQRGEPEALVAEIVVEDARPTVPHTTDISRLAAGSILEQIGKLLGSL